MAWVDMVYKYSVIHLLVVDVSCFGTIADWVKNKTHKTSMYHKQMNKGVMN